MKNSTRISFIFFILYWLFFPAENLAAEEIDPQEPSMNMYKKEPALFTSPVKPSVMLMLDNSGSMITPAYRPRSNAYNHSRDYYGLFKPELYYHYNSSKKYFEQCAENSTQSNCPWSGNFLNWLTMRRIDISKKVLTGGATMKRYGDTCLYTQPWPSYYLKGYSYNKNKYPDKNGNERTITPHHCNNRTVFVYFTSTSPASAIFYLSKDGVHYYQYGPRLGKYDLVIKVPEGEEIKGLIQKTASDIRYGLTVFNRRRQGGDIKQYIGAKVKDIIDDINSDYPNGGTPLAETLYTIGGYMAQSKRKEKEKWTVVGPRYYTTSYRISKKWDPFYDNDKQEYIPCSKAFVVMLTDGYPSGDMNIPARYRDNYQTKNIVNIARYVHRTDLRSDESGMQNAAKVLAGKQNITLYPVYTFGNTPTPPTALIEAAKKGGFDSDAEVEYKDDNGVQIPKNLFNAKDGKALETALQETFNEIRNTATSGTSIAVPSSSVDGSGATFQTVYRPSRPNDDGDDIAWTGNVQALLIDPQGNSREDTNKNQQLDMIADLIIKTKTDETSGAVSVVKYKDYNGDGILSKHLIERDDEDLNGNGVSGETIDETQEAGNCSLKKVSYLWSGAEWLNDISDTNILYHPLYLGKENKRYLFTYFDINDNGKVNSGEIKRFTQDLANDNRYIGYFLGTATGDIRDFNNDKNIDREDLKILINYIRGKDYPGNAKLRSRRYNGKTWRLGDIINSSPVAVQAPFAGYDTVYNDKSYRKFKRKYSDRRTVVYTGSNDGIFHAFNGGFYQKEYTDTNGNTFYNKFWKYCKKDDNGTLTCNDSHPRAIALGQEIWGYIPQNLLPHLQWLPQTDYSHIYYNDLSPFIFEAQLWDKENDSLHVGGWGTLLIGGMRFGGGPIEVNTKAFDGDPQTTEKRLMRSAYFLMDITDPEGPPILLDEFSIDTYKNTGSDKRTSFTTVLPSLEYVTSDNGRDWFLVFGTGPTTLDGKSTDRARVFIYKLPSFAGTTQGGLSAIDVIDTSSWTKIFEIDEQNSFIGNFYGADFQVGSNPGAFTTDAIYFGTVFGDTNQWKGKLHRIVVQNGLNDPASITSWEDKVLFNAQAPISIKPQISLDNNENVWAYFGTGRFYAPEDKENSQQMKLYGIRESMVYNRKLHDKIPEYKEIKKEDLFNSTNIKVYAGTAPGEAEVVGGGVNNFSALENLIDNKKQGWFVELAQGNGDQGERVIVNPVIRSQVVNFNTFVPSTDICDLSSKGYAYDFYYKTGTAFWNPIMGTKKEGDKERSISRIDIGGLSSSSAFHSGENGLTQTIQRADGGVEKFPIKTPGPNKSGRVFWEDIEE